MRKRKKGQKKNELKIAETRQETQDSQRKIERE